MRRILACFLSGCMLASLMMASVAAKEEGKFLVPYGYVKEEKIPQIHISTENEIAIDDPSLIDPDEHKGLGGEIPVYNYVKAQVSVSNCEGFALEEVPSKVKVRGNYTSLYPKKPIRIKFEEKQAMCGLNGGAKMKSWVLLAEYKDPSLLRNALAFTLAKSFYTTTDQAYSADFRPVEVYLNGEYQGVYLLTEQQEVDEHRVNVPELEDEVHTGYFFEYDGYYMQEEELERFAITYDELLHEDGSSFDLSKGQDADGGMGPFGAAMDGWGDMARGFGQMFQDGFPSGMPGTASEEAVSEEKEAVAENKEAVAEDSEVAAEEGDAATGGFPGTFGNFGGEGFDWRNTDWGNFDWGDFDWGNMDWGAFDWGDMNWEGFSGGMGFNAGRLAGSAGFTIKSDITSESQQAFLSCCVQTIWQVLYDAAYGEHSDIGTAPYHTMDGEGGYVEDPSIETAQEAVEKVVDIETLVDMYILQEICEDSDLDWSSFFFSLDMSEEGKRLLTYTAPWDFDSAFGNNFASRDNSVLYAMNTNLPWLVVFAGEEWFWDRVYERYQEAMEAGVFTQAAQMLDDYATLYADAYAKNNEKWKAGGGGMQVWSEGVTSYETQAEATAALKDWYLERIENLEKLLQEKAQ